LLQKNRGDGKYRNGHNGATAIGAVVRGKPPETLDVATAPLGELRSCMLR